jgi:hypothetical protein
MSKRFLPKKFESHPVIGRMTAFATMYDVITHVASGMLADRLPAMCGRDTFTTEVSMISMIVDDITAMTIQDRATDGRVLIELITPHFPCFELFYELGIK